MINATDLEGASSMVAGPMENDAILDQDINQKGDDYMDKTTDEIMNLNKDIT